MGVRAADNSKDSIRITVLGFLVNVFLIVFKLLFGIVGHSYALIADAIHSFADLITDAITFIGVFVGSQPADEQHPYGHKKIETLAEIAMGCVLIFVACGIAYRSGHAIYAHDSTIPGVSTIVVAAISVIVKEILYQVTVRVGRVSQNTVVCANAWHHRSDALTSVAVLIGIVVVRLVPTVSFVDAFLGFLIAFLIVRIGHRLCVDAIARIIDTRPRAEFFDAVSKIVSSLPEVQHYHNLKMRYIGSDIAIEMHVEVDANMSVYDSHDIARTIKRMIMSTYREVYDVLIHIEPAGNHYGETGVVLDEDKGN